MRSPLRILMTADTLGGVFSYAVTLCRALSARGVEIVLATEGARLDKEQRSELDGIERLLVCESTFALEWMDDPWAEVDRAGEWLLGLERDFGPDVVHVNGYAHAAQPFSAPVVLVAHSSVPSWWRAVLGEVAPARYDEYRRRARAAFCAARRVVAPSRSMLRELAANDAFSGAATIIPNGMDRGLFRAAEKEPFVLAAGRLWDKAKNLELIAAAAPDLSWPVRVAGDTPRPDAPTRCESLGRLSRAELATWMARASIFVHPARYEPFGLAPLEAALSRCALVLGAIDSLKEVWGDAAMYVDPGDRSGLVDAVERLAHDSVLRREMSGAAYARALEFGVEPMVNAYLSVYRELAWPWTSRSAGRPS